VVTKGVAEGVEVGKNSVVFEGEGVVVVVGIVLGANISDLVLVEAGETMVEAVAEVTFVGVGAVGTVLTGRCIRTLSFGAGIALQLTRPPVCSTAAHTPPISAPVEQCRTRNITREPRHCKSQINRSETVWKYCSTWRHSCLAGFCEITV
jgi:hypothetical protein